MEKKSRPQYIAGLALFGATAMLVVAVLALLCRTDKADIYLGETAARRYGWRYELLLDGRAQDFTPEFADGYSPGVPADARAVRITRTMAEALPRAELEWGAYGMGMEVELDGAVLYSDFPGAERDGDGFAKPTQADWARLARGQGEVWRRVRMTLPADYAGKALRMTTYFPPGTPASAPEYPFLGSEDSNIAGLMVAQTLPMVSLVVYAILALLLAGMFTLDISVGGTNARTLLLSLYFSLQFLKTACDSGSGYYSLLGGYPGLAVLGEMYLAPLGLFLALRLQTRLKYPLCAGILFWTAFEGVRQAWGPGGTFAGASLDGPGALLLLAALLAAFFVDFVRHRGNYPKGWRKPAALCLAWACVTAFCLLNRVQGWGSVRAYLVDGVLAGMRAGHFSPFLGLLAEVTSVVAAIFVSLDTVRRALQARRGMDILRERSRLTLQGYERMVNAEQKTNAARHEMRHHITALMALLESGDNERARRYVATIAQELDALPPGRYSQNLLVNVIAGTYLDRAQAQGIRVEHMLPVPPALAVADEDISVLLSNMLQNALEACERMPAQADRFICIEMSVFNGFLFIKCANSMPPDEDAAAEMKTHRPGHGYGLAAMRRIAKKYGGVLTVEATPGAFSVKTALCLEGGAAQGGSVSALPEQ